MRQQSSSEQQIIVMISFDLIPLLFFINMMLNKKEVSSLVIELTRIMKIFALNNVHEREKTTTTNGQN